ncbi:MAG: hypothetical protein AAF384_18005, partial [Pseudomonadota bacterium]
MDELSHKSTHRQTIPVIAGGFGSWEFSLRRRPLPAFELAERYDRAAPKWQRTTSRLGAPRGYDFLFERFLTQS